MEPSMGISAYYYPLPSHWSRGGLTPVDGGRVARQSPVLASLGPIGESFDKGIPTYHLLSTDSSVRTITRSSDNLCLQRFVDCLYFEYNRPLIPVIFVHTLLPRWLWWPRNSSFKEKKIGENTMMSTQYLESARE